MTKNTLALLLTAPLITACVADAESQDEQALLVYQDPPPPPPPQTTLTLFADANYSGASWTVSLLPSTALEATQLITTSDLNAHGLYGRVSSVRLVCGERPSRVSLFDGDWSEWAKGTMLECDAYHGAAVNLATVGYDDRINAAALVVHPAGDSGIAFSRLFDTIWAGDVEDLPDGATATGTEIWLETWNTFRIYQHFKLSHLGCSDRDAAFDLRVRLSTTNNLPVFSTITMSVWAAYGFGDAWGCHDGMVAKLQSAASDAATKLDTGLPALILGVGNSSPTFYFTPTQTTAEFETFYVN